VFLLMWCHGMGWDLLIYAGKVDNIRRVSLFFVFLATSVCLVISIGIILLIDNQIYSHVAMVSAYNAILICV